MNFIYDHDIAPQIDDQAGATQDVREDTEEWTDCESLQQLQ